MTEQIERDECEQEHLARIVAEMDSICAKLKKEKVEKRDCLFTIVDKILGIEIKICDIIGIKID